MIIGWIVACVVVHHNRHHHHQEYTRILGRWWLYVGWLHAWWTGGTAIMWLPLVFRTCFWLICLKQLLYFGWYVWNIYFTLVDMLEIFNILWLVCLKCLLNYYMFKTCHSVEMKCQIEFFFCDKNILWFRNISIFLIPHSLIRFCLSSQVGDRRMKSGNNSKFNWDISFQWQWKILILIFFKNFFNILFDIL